MAAKPMAAWMCASLDAVDFLAAGDWELREISVRTTGRNAVSETAGKAIASLPVLIRTACAAA